MDYYHILLVLLLITLFVLILYIYKYYFSFKEHYWGDNMFTGDDLSLDSKTSTTNNNTKEEVKKTSWGISFSLDKNKKVNPTTTKQPPFDGMEYKINNSYEQSYPKYKNKKIMRTNKRDKEDLNPYEDIPFIHKIVYNKKKKETREWKDISTKNKKFIKELNNLFTNYAVYVEDIKKDTEKETK
jgi:hypothetical protein